MSAPRPGEVVTDDAEARRLIAQDHDHTLVVEAAAGTGKTTALVSRILAVLRAGHATLAEIVAVTFTDKAAGEMKLRLREGLERERVAEGISLEERARLDLALEQLELAAIGTIHSFCADILRAHPVEAGVDPRFEMLVDEQGESLRSVAFDEWLARALSRLDRHEGLRRIMRRRPARSTDASPREQLEAAAGTLIQYRDVEGAWRRDPWDRDAAIDGLVGRVAEVGAFLERATDRWSELSKKLWHLQSWAAEEAKREEAAGGRDYDGLEARLRDLAFDRFLWEPRGRGTYYGEGLLREDVLAARDALLAELTAFVAASDADLAPLLQAELAPVVRRYEELKEHAGLLDFMDLLRRARDLVRDHPGVRRELCARYTRLFVDEVQDTDPLQVELLLLLSARDPERATEDPLDVAPGKLFLVGDPKQSIYRFRRADMAIYHRLVAGLRARGAKQLYLSRSFRAVPGIQAFVNDAFARAMDGAAPDVQPAYVPLERHREPLGDQPSVVALSVPRPFGDRGKVTKKAVIESLPDTVAAFVAWLLESELRVSGEDGAPRPIEARDVCLLFRQFRRYGEDATRPFAHALEARGVGHVLVGGRSFHDREEVTALRSALHAIEHPDDELHVYATLRGPFFAFHDEDLFLFRREAGHLHPLRPVAEPVATGPRGPVAEALSLLGKLHVRRNRRPLAETVSAVLDATRAHAGVAIWPAGPQALSNLLRVVDHARRLDGRGAASFRAFVEWLDAQRDRAAAGDAPVVEDGTDGVRIMTVHKAKGLEVPVVILCDPTLPLPTRPGQWVDPERALFAAPLAGCAPAELREREAEVTAADQAEVVRLAYVAATRAKDLLVVPAVGDAPVDGWLSVLDPALYPARELRREAEPAPGCPAFGDDSVLDRPSSAGDASESVRPGLHRSLAGGHGVVFWDPRALALDVPLQGGQRQQELLAADEAGRVAAEEGVRAHAAWAAARDEARERASMPAVVALSVTALSKDRVPGPMPVAVERTGAAHPGRPRGPRFGTLVHEVLAAAPLDADEARVRALCLAHARLLGAPDDEREAAVLAAVAALAHPLVRRAARAEALRRETPLVLRLADGTLAEGVVDLAFREAGRWTVVDFKTDLGPAPAGPAPEVPAPAYRAQLELYARAIGEVTGEPCEAVLLGV